MTKKEKLEWLQKRFLQDLTKLSEKYENQELGELTDIDPANLSRYKKNPPGITVLRKFYNRLAGILENPFEKINLIMEDKKDTKDEQKGSNDSNGSNEQKSGPNYNHNDSGSHKTEEPKGPPPSDKNEADQKLLAVYQDMIAHHRNMDNRMMDNLDKVYGFHYKMLDSFNQMVAVHAATTQKDLINAETQNKIVDDILKKKDEQAK